MPQRAAVPTLRLFIGGATDELRVVPVELSMLTIGRRPYNDLPLDHLTVSGEHAMLRRRNGEFVVYDLNSRNGTLVNGLPIQHRVLVDGDVIDIGVYRLRFEAAAGTDGGASPPAGMDRSIDSVPGASIAERGSAAGGQEAPNGEGTSAWPGVEFVQPGAAADLPVATNARCTDAAAANGHDPAGTADGSANPANADAAPADATPWASIEHLNGPQTGQRRSLERTINRIGGAAEQVAVISRRKGGFFITHLEGLTFPQVNGESIGLTAHRLSDGDLIELAGAMLRFRLDS